jgi:DNA-binding transcriptional ArsR family regulator
MALTLDLSITDLATARFAVSPLSETISGLQLLGNRWGPGRHRRWARWAAGQVAARPLDLSLTWPLIVSDRPSWPQWLLPAPATAATTIDDDLDAMRQTGAHQVRFSLRRIFGDRPPPRAAEFYADPAAGLRAIAAELRQAHDRLIAPHWPRLRAVLDADIAYRARQLASGGAARLFTGLHPDLRWRDGLLTLDGDHRPSPGRPPGGVLLSPVALGPPWVMIKLRTTTQTTVRYPARGTGTLWEAGPRPVPGSTARLLGRRRAGLLEALRSPSTVTDLARELRVSPSAVSQHLRVLRESGLVAGERSGRSVRYLTTERGLALLDPEPAGDLTFQRVEGAQSSS